MTAENLFYSLLTNQEVAVATSKVETNHKMEEKMLYNGYDAATRSSHAGQACPIDALEYFNSDIDYHFHNSEAYITSQYVSLTYVADAETTYRIKATVVRRYCNQKKSMNDSGFNYSTDMASVQINYDFYKIKTTAGKISPARVLQPIVSAWYVTLRNIALVALLSVLVYIGIRITLSSVASDKAKYKQMLTDWVVALCLVFLMHYIMSFAVTINEKIIQAISSVTTTNLYTAEDIQGTPDYQTGDTNEIKVDEDENNDKQQSGVQLFKIDNKKAVENAYKTLVGDKGKDSSFYNRFTDENKDGSILFWPANDFMTQARILGQGATVAEGQDAPDLDSKNVSVARAGYNIIYVVLVIYTVMFCFTYLKRLIYLAFLTIIAPLVAITYPIDKISDGQAQAFNMWLKEYIFNLLIQPMHLILYTVLVGSAMEFASINIFYVVVALGFLIPAEKLLRRFFGFEKAQTAGAFGGAAGAALMMSGLSRLLHPKSSKGSLGSGDKNSKDGEEETKTPPWKDKEFDATDNLIGSGGQDSGTEQSEFRNNLNEEEQGRFDLARTGREEALAGANDATTEEERQEYNNLADSYNRDLNEFRNPNWSPGDNGQGRQGVQLKNNAKRTNNKKRKRSVIRGIRRGSRSYLTGMGNKMKAKYKANGGIVRRGARMAAGLTAATLGAAGAGLIGITTGDPSKAAQYMATAGVGGYALGRGAANSAADKLKVEGSIQEAKKGYYGDDYKKVQQEKYKKEYMKNEENLRRIEDKLKVERKEAKKIMEENIGYYLDHEVSDIDDAIATYKLEKEGRMSREQAVATAQYATQVMNGEDTRTMTAKRKKEYRDTFIPKFQQQGSRNASGDVDTLFKNVDKFHRYKK